MANKINFGVGFSVDKSGLDGVVKQLREIQQMSSKDLININKTDLRTAEGQLYKIKDTAKKVETALEQAFNTRLNTVNLQVFNDQLNKQKLTLNQVQQSFAQAGAQGQNAFRSLAVSLTSLNKEIKTTDTLLDRIGKTLGNTIRWNLSSSIVNQMSGSIQEAYGYVKHLDSALNDIRIVTGKSAEEMDTFAQKANTAAQALGKSTNDYTEAALIYAQQGRPFYA